MKVIFLDIDGVLNSKVSRAEAKAAMNQDDPTDPDWDHFNPICSPLAWNPHSVAQMIRVVDATGAKIVLSSSWRMFPEHTRACLHACSVIGTSARDSHPLDFIDTTEFGVWSRFSNNRGEEIHNWLTDHPEVTHFVIIDDAEPMTFLSDQLANFVNTDDHVGFTRDDADRAIAILEAEQSQDTQIKDNIHDTTHAQRSEEDV